MHFFLFRKKYIILYIYFYRFFFVVVEKTTVSNQMHSEERGQEERDRILVYFRDLMTVRTVKPYGKPALKPRGS